MGLNKEALEATHRIWFDTEFIEDGRTIELVSIGMVREDGATYYAECAEADLSRGDEWMEKNVYPHLTGETKPRAQIAAEIISFVGQKPEFWAYYADYDWVALCQLYGRMIDLPKGWPMFCRDLKQKCVDLLNPQLPKQTGAEHNALADAQWNLQVWDFLTTLAPADNGLVEWLRAGMNSYDETETDDGVIELYDIEGANDLMAQAADTITAQAAEIEQLKAERDALKDDRFDGLWRFWNAKATKYFAERVAAEARLSALEALLDKAVKVLEPFVDLAGAVFHVDEDGREMNARRADDDCVWGFDKVELTYGHLRAVRSTLTAIQEARHAGD